jgi:hypothetical protein
MKVMNLKLTKLKFSSTELPKILEKNKESSGKEMANAFWGTFLN